MSKWEKQQKQVWVLWIVKVYVGVILVLSMAVMVTIAYIHDSKAAYLLIRYLKELCSNIKVILADGGYHGEIADEIKTSLGYILEVVERTFAWFDNYRRLCRNYELTFDSAEEMVKLASIRMLLNKI